MTTETRKFIGKAHCGYQNRKPFVCCTVENAPTPPPLRKRFSDELPTPGECGFSLQDKILSGATAKITDFPWMALLQYTKPDGSKDFHCAGELLKCSGDKFFKFSIEPIYRIFDQRPIRYNSSTC